MRYSRRALNYLERKNIISNLIHVMGMTNFIAFSVETLKIDSVCSLDKEFTKLIRMNP